MQTVLAMENGGLAQTLAAAILILIAGVVLPAVWSRNGSRRTAALTVLRLLLASLRRHQ